MTEKIATREAYGKAIVELGKDNKDVVVLDADLSKSTKTALFAKEFPERFFDMGIAEQNMIGTAAGLSLGGKIPFASSFAIFATGRAFEQVRNSVCYPNLNVKIAATHAGVTVGEDGGSHQTIEDIAIMRVLPNMTVIVPADAVEAGQAIHAAAELKGPCYIRLGRSKVPVIHNDQYQFKIGKAHTARKGEDVTIIACGLMVAEALKAAEELAQEGIEAMVINAATVKPLDEETILQAVKQTGAAVTAEEHSIIGGLGSAVTELLAEHYPVPVKRVGVTDKFGESGSPAELLQHFGLTAEGIRAAAKEVIKRKK